MSLKSCTVADTNRRKLEIEVDAATFDAACDTAYRKAAAKISVPGFRKGKAPRHVIEKMYGTEFYIEDAVNAVYPDALEAAIKESEIEYVDDKIDLDVVSLGKGEGLVFTAVVTVKPEVKLTGDYKGLKAEQRAFEITDEAVEAEFEKGRERDARVVDVDDRPAQNGDTACFDFTGYVDGVPFDGGAAENYTLELGSGQFIPGFEEQMVGHNVGEEFDVNVTFPEEYHAEELKGKPAVFKIKLHSLSYKELPEADDEYAKDKDFDTLEEYKADIRKHLEEHEAGHVESEVEDQLMSALVELLDAEIPDAMIENQLDINVQDFAYRIQGSGMDFNTYIQYVGGIDAVRDQLRPRAESQTKLRLVLEYITRAEEITASEDEINAKYAELSEMSGRQIDDIKTIYTPEDVAADIAADKAVKFIRDNADITVVDKSADAAADDETADNE